jgi:hypothetical protein
MTAPFSGTSIVLVSAFFGTSIPLVSALFWYQYSSGVRIALVPAFLYTDVLSPEDRTSHDYLLPTPSPSLRLLGFQQEVDQEDDSLAGQQIRSDWKVAISIAISILYT